MTAIGETVIIRSISDLIRGAKTHHGRDYLSGYFRRNVETDGFILAEVLKVSARKYQLLFIVTEDNSFCVEDDSICFTADWYDIKRLNDSEEVTYYNAFLGECSELRMKGGPL